MNNEMIFRVYWSAHKVFGKSILGGFKKTPTIYYANDIINPENGWRDSQARE